MINIEIKLGPGSDKLIQRLQILRSDLEDQAEAALDQSAAAILSRLRTTFRAEQDPSRSPWVPSAAGLRRKARGTGQTMFDTGNLFRSMQLYVDSATQRRIGTDVEYGPRLQNPTKGPPRPFIDLTDEHVELTRRIFERKIKELLREQGL